MRGKTAVFQIPSRCLRTSDAPIDEPLELPNNEALFQRDPALYGKRKDWEDDERFVTVQIWLQQPPANSQSAFASDSDDEVEADWGRPSSRRRAGSANGTSAFNPPQSPSKIPGASFSAQTPAAATDGRRFFNFSSKHHVARGAHKSSTDRRSRRSRDTSLPRVRSDVDVVQKIDGWMCELAAWKLSDLFDVASRLHVGRRSWYVLSRCQALLSLLLLLLVRFLVLVLLLLFISALPVRLLEAIAGPRMRLRLPVGC